MLYFKDKLHQIQFRLWLRLRSRWGSSQGSLRPPSWIQGVLLLKEGEGKKKRGKGRKEKDKKGEGREGGRKGQKDILPPPLIGRRLDPPLSVALCIVAKWYRPTS